MVPDHPSLHWSFVPLGLVALVWHLGGIMNLSLQQSEKTFELMPESHQIVVSARPDWAGYLFAFSVCAGALGAVLLLARWKAAIPVFAASLLGTVVVVGQSVIGGGALDVFSGGEVAMVVVAPIVFAGFLTWYCIKNRNALR